MKSTNYIRFLIIVIAIVSVGVGLSPVSMGQAEDDYATISRMPTLKERREFFVSLSPERKSAIWRKHYETELAKHPELTSDQKAVVNLAIVMASPDLFAGKLPDVAGPGSVFASALEKAFKNTPALSVEIFGQLGPPLPKPSRQSDSKSK